MIYGGDQLFRLCSRKTETAEEEVEEEEEEALLPCVWALEERRSVDINHGWAEPDQAGGPHLLHPLQVPTSMTSTGARGQGSGVRTGWMQEPVEASIHPPPARTWAEAPIRSRRRRD